MAVVPEAAKWMGGDGGLGGGAAKEASLNATAAVAILRELHHLQLKQHLRQLSGSDRSTRSYLNATTARYRKTHGKRQQKPERGGRGYEDQGKGKETGDEEGQDKRMQEGKQRN
eukprot:359586-Chlamydomonas_euryale.AAC.5